jgi:hypothetical protein
MHDRRARSAAKRMLGSRGEVACEDPAFLRAKFTFRKR